MAGLYEADFVLRLPQSFHNSVDAIAGNPKNCVNAPVNQRLDDYFARSLCHWLFEYSTLETTLSGKRNEESCAGETRTTDNLAIAPRNSFVVPPSTVWASKNLRNANDRQMSSGELVRVESALSGRPTRLIEAWRIVDRHIKTGRFQRSLALVTAGSSLISGLEVAYEHYKGSYSNPVMYTPVALSGVLAASSIHGFFSRSAAQRNMRWSAALTLVDGIVGFGFHIRGIARKPGGWKFPLTNMIMGPPIFAPLLFGTAAYLGLMASYLKREEDDALTLVYPQGRSTLYTGWRQEIYEGRFQKHLAAVAALWTVLSGSEAWYSHYKSRFRNRAQWTPVILTPIQFAACIGAIFSRRVAQRLLPVTSAAAVINGAVGFGYHVRGIARRPGGKKKWLYNILYGPPIFAPLLFAACGALGLLACVLRREGRDG